MKKKRPVLNIRCIFAETGQDPRKLILQSLQQYIARTMQDKSPFYYGKKG